MEDEFKKTVQQETECFVCLEPITNSHMCPYCRKCGCLNCFVGCLSKNNQCPFCRHQLEPDELIKDNLMSALKNVNKIYNIFF